MILFTILSIILIVLMIGLVFAIAIGGAGAIILFGDVIVCGFIIVWIMRHLIKKKR